MESLYARDTPTAQELKLRAAQRDQNVADAGEGQVALKPVGTEHLQQESDHSIKTSTQAGEVAPVTESPNPTDDAFGFTFAREELDEQWRRDLPVDSEEGKTKQEDEKKKEEGKQSEETAAAPSSAAEKIETKTAESSQQEVTPTAPVPTLQARRAGVASAPRKMNKPAITINTGSSSSSIGAKRPPPTPVSPPTFSWNDILSVQNLIERCLQQYKSKNEILMTLKEETNVDPAFTNVVWQKLEEQNPMFFRAYSLQLQLKEQINHFNYLVTQQKEMAAKGGKRLLHYSTMNRQSAGRAAPCSLNTTSTTTTLPPISMDARTFLRTPIRSAKQQRTFGQQQHMNMYQLGSPSVGTSSGMTTMPPPSPLPLPSPIKTDLDTHAFFT